MGMNPRLLRPRASGFNPKSISGLSLWLDGADSSTITLNGTTVSQWADKSGNGRNATQGTALNQPGTSTVNGKGAILFDGTNDNLQLGDLSAAFSTAATAFYVLTQHTGASAGSYMAAATRNNSGWWRYVGSSSYLGVFRTTRLANVNFNINAASVNGVTVLSSSSTYEVYYQGAKLHTATADHNGGNSHVIGAGGDGAGLQYFLGSMCEVLYYNRALSAADLATVHKYLSKKWGFTLS